MKKEAVKESAVRFFIFRLFIFLFLFLSAFSARGLRAFAQEQKNPEGVTDAYGNGTSLLMLYEDKKERIGDGEIYADVSCRYANYVKYGRYMCLDIILYNDSEDDFKGYVRTVLSDADGTMYQRSVSVKKYKHKSFCFVFPADFKESHFSFSVVDQKDNEVASSELGLNISTDSDNICIGVISDYPEELSYLDCGSTSVIDISPEDIVQDRKALELMDIIVVNSESAVSGLKESQINALVQWVNNGGTLVIAAESSSSSDAPLSTFNNRLYRVQSVYDSILKVTSFGLQDSNIPALKNDLKRDLKEKRTESVKQFLKENLSPEMYVKRASEIENIEDNTAILSRSGEIYNFLSRRFTKRQLDSALSFSVSDDEEKKADKLKIRMVPESIHSLMISGASALVSENGENIVQYLDSELGRVIFFETDIGLEKKYFDTEGTQIRNIIKDNISAEGKNKLRSEGMNASQNSEYYYTDGLGKNDNSNLPNIFLYVLVILIYLAVNGPVVYLLLRKKNRVMYVWVTIPAISLVFSLLIYFLGTSTRIERPFSNYLAQLNIRDSGQAQLTTYFSLSSPSKKKYKALFEGSRDITTLNSSTGISYGNSSGKYTSDYRYGVESSENTTAILMKNVPAFSQINFCDRTYLEEKRSLQCRVNADRNDFSGSVTNNIGTDMEKCFIFDNGRAVRLGDIKEGQKITFSTAENPEKLIVPSDYTYDISGFGAVLLGHSPSDRDSEYSVTEQRMKDLINAYVSSPVNSEGVYFYGFASGDENPLVSELGVSMSGITGISQNITLSHTYNGDSVIPDISLYKLKYDTDLTDGVHVYADNDKEIQVTYSLPANRSYVTLIYSSDNNSEFGTYGSEFSEVFEGTVSVRDPESGRKKVIFESGVEGTQADISRFISKNHTLTLFYNVESQGNGKELRLPQLMLSVESSSEGS